MSRLAAVVARTVRRVADAAVDAVVIVATGGVPLENSAATGWRTPEDWPAGDTQSLEEINAAFDEIDARHKTHGGTNHA